MMKTPVVGMTFVVAATLVLAGCANPLESLAEGAVEEAAEQAIEGASGGEVDIDFDGSGASLPDSWPSDLPVPDGKISLSSSVEGNSIVHMEVSDKSAFDEMVATFESAGFTEVQSQDLGTSIVKILENGDRTGSVTLLDLDGEFILQVGVSTGE